MRKYKLDIPKLIGIGVFLIVAVVSVWYANHEKNQNNGSVGMDCYVDFIDCGQGDSVLLISGETVTLIDASTKSETDKIVSHLKERGVDKIDHFVLSHPHEDHIGGAKEILESFEVENIYMKRPTTGTEPTSSVYINLLRKIKEQGKTVHSVKPQDSFGCGSFEITVLGPVDDYKDLNDQSVVLRAIYGEVSFLFTGDQEIVAEEDLIKRYGIDLKSTVLKVGHHGSSTSSGADFLKVVDPEYAVISCGEGNSYGHPHRETIERFNEMGIRFFRTDQQGTVSFYTDGTLVREVVK